MAITSFLKRCCPINRPSSSHWRRQSSRTAERRSWFSGADATATATTTTRSYAIRIILCVLQRRLCHHRSLGMSPLCHSYLMLFIGNIIIALWHPSVILLLERHRGDREPTTQLVCLAVFVLLSGVDVGNVLPLLLLLLLQPDRRSMGVPLGTVVQKF